MARKPPKPKKPYQPVVYSWGRAKGNLLRPRTATAVAKVQTKGGTDRGKQA